MQAASRYGALAGPIEPNGDKWVYRHMAAALRLAPWLLIAVAAEPAAAQTQAPRLKLQSLDVTGPNEPARAQHEPLFKQRFDYERETLPDWTFPFGTRADERGRRGVSFGIRPGRGVKATARIRF